jgi:4'-phosphopantetheinyl transferase
MCSEAEGVPDMVVETCATTTAGPRRMQGWAALLDAGERARAEAFRFPEDRRDYVAAHGLKRELLGRWLGFEPAALRFARAEPGGRPLLATPGVAGCQFSLTHTRGLVGCVAARGFAVGIDAEAAERPVGPGLAEQALAAAELAWLGRQPEALRSAAFMRIWTLKEALLKAVGLGLAGLRQCAVLPTPPTVLALPPGMDQDGWRLAQWEPAPGHIAALAWRRGAGVGAEFGLPARPRGASGGIRTPRRQAKNALRS